MATDIVTIRNGTTRHKSSRPALSATRAIAKANGYLSKYVGVLFGAETPVFLPLPRPIWQVSVTFKMNDIGPFTVGLLDVDAATGEVLPLSTEQILSIEERTDAYLKSRTYAPETARLIVLPPVRSWRLPTSALLCAMIGCYACCKLNHLAPPFITYVPWMR